MASTINANNTTGLVSTADTSGILQLQTNGTTAVTVDDSQRVGIGTTSPSRLLHLNAALPILQFTNPTTGTTANDGTLLYQNGANFTIEQQDSGYINVVTGGTERARIDSSGNLLVGTTSNPNGTRATIKAGNGTQLTLDNDGSQFTEVYWANNGTNKSYMWWDNTNTRFQIQSGGSGGVYLASTGTSWTSASDERVKDIIEPIENATQKLSDWRAVVGKYKADEEGTRRSFLIAQDVLATFPEAVDTTNADEYGVRYQDTIPVLVKAIQEQQALITQLQADVSALKGAQA